MGKLRLRVSIRFLACLTLLFALGFATLRFRMTANKNLAVSIALLEYSPNSDGWNFDPIAMVRVVNKLQACGSKDAVFILERFISKFPFEGGSGVHQNLELVIPLLFDRCNPEDLFPEPNDSPPGFELTRESWSICVVVEQGIPFHVATFSGSGAKINQDYLIHWAKHKARLRADPLVPSDDPFSAAENTLRRIDNSDGEDSESLKRHIRMQVYRAVAHLVKDDESLLPLDEESWKRLEFACKSIRISWSKDKQAYCANK